MNASDEINLQQKNYFTFLGPWGSVSEQADPLLARGHLLWVAKKHVIILNGSINCIFFQLRTTVLDTKGKLIDVAKK